jgi:hypothetical protein
MAIKTFTTGEVLTASDTNTYLNNGGLVYITQATISGTSTSINNCFTSTYANYLINVNIASASTNADIRLRLRVGGVDSNGPYDQKGDIAVTTTSVKLGDSSNSYGYGTIQIGGPQAADYTVGSILYHGLNTGVAAAGYRTTFDADVQTQFDGFTVFSTATLTGTMFVYGYRNA